MVCCINDIPTASVLFFVHFYLERRIDRKDDYMHIEEKYQKETLRRKILQLPLD
jgi:hypothetical protein